MLIVGDTRASTLATCLAAAPHFQLDARAAIDTINRQIRTIQATWDAVCDDAKLTPTDRNLLSQRMFLNDFVFEGAPKSIGVLHIA